MTTKSNTGFRVARSLVLGLLMCCFVGSAKAGQEVNTGYFGNIAIQGFDTVAYFTEGKPVKGKEEFTHKWLGAEWRFANKEHLELFVDNPQSYAPQYGGHCATGLAVHGNLTKDIDPEAWVIIDDKLYFNYSKGTQDLLIDNVISLDTADANWVKATGVTN